MKKIIIDINALISFVTDRNIKHSQIMYDIFSGKENFRIYILSNVISEFVYVMTKIYSVDSLKVSEIVNDLLKMPNLDFVEGYFPETIFSIWPEQIKDFGDGVIAAASLTLKLPVYTFDKKFAGQLEKIKCNQKLLGS